MRGLRAWCTVALAMSGLGAIVNLYLQDPEVSAALAFAALTAATIQFAARPKGTHQ